MAIDKTKTSSPSTRKMAAVNTTPKTHYMFREPVALLSQRYKTSPNRFLTNQHHSTHQSLVLSGIHRFYPPERAVWMVQSSVLHRHFISNQHDFTLLLTITTIQLGIRFSSRLSRWCWRYEISDKRRNHYWRLLTGLQRTTTPITMHYHWHSGQHRLGIGYSWNQTHKTGSVPTQLQSLFTFSQRNHSNGRLEKDSSPLTLRPMEHYISMRWHRTSDHHSLGTWHTYRKILLDRIVRRSKTSSFRSLPRHRPPITLWSA